MNRSTIDLWVGIFVTIGLGAVVFLALKVGNLTSFNTAPGYRVEARFDNIGGLKLRAPVKAAGVIVGRVESVKLDPTTYEAVVTLRIDNGYQFTEGHDRVDPDLRAAGRGLHRPRNRRRPADARRQRQDHEDAVGGRAREVNQPVPVRQGRQRSRRPK